MNTKWYFGAIIAILTLFGLNQKNLVVPNQEIVLQFSTNEVSSNQVQFAISNIKKQLETIGVSKVDIREGTNGRLVISYYSDTSVANVKDIFSANTFAIDYVSNVDKQSEFPKEQTYNLDVFEITKSSDTGFGSKGKLFLEAKQDFDRFSNPNYYVYVPNSNTSEKNIEVLVAYKHNKTIAVAINNIPYIIPEGRAGPIV